MAATGKLTTTAQKHYAGPTRQREELYDTANDPHQINNLAGRSARSQSIAQGNKPFGSIKL